MKRIGIVVLALALGACASNARSGNDRTSEDARASNQIEIKGIAYSPSNLSVQRGATVTWVNHDPVAHTVTAGTPGKQGVPGVSADAPPKLTGLFDRELNAKETSFSFTFERPGVYRFFCRVHNSMQGTITVR
ncbi:MAG: plastocyanin/azurin family copper-binding protein [Actinomycetota bacterium]|nr:plastocyanin/azurin family copper-binding protein [Actinomycetota bacterium]